MMISLNRNIDQLKKIINSDILINESMRDHTSFRIGGPADIFITPNSIEDLINVVHYSRDNDLPLYTIGRGTNLLVSDRGIRGIVIKIGGVLDHLELFEDKLRVSAGAHLPSLSRFAARNGLSGLEFGIGIPGTVGGAVVMNAGCAGQDIGQVVTEVKILNRQGEVETLPGEQLDYSYKKSRFTSQKGEIVLEAQMKLEEGDIGDIEKRMEWIKDKRRRTLPQNFPSAGCIFKNPEGDFAGRLIDLAGCKGIDRGDAIVSELHANFILNRGYAKAGEVLALIDEVRDRVRKAFGIELELEVKLLGEF